MKIPEINTVCFVGAGSMGCFNSLLAAIAGYEAIVYDVSETMLEQLNSRQRELAGYIAATGICTEENAVSAMSRVSTCRDLLLVADRVDLVSESVFEQLDKKREVHRQLDKIFPSKTIITTNTSTLTVSQIEDALTRGESFAALHSHLGATLMDIVAGPRTSQATIDILNRYVLSLGCEPMISKKENPGYIYNAMFGPFLNRALHLVASKRASIEDVDRAWMVHQDTAFGPFGIMDFLGINIIYDGRRTKLSIAVVADKQDDILNFLEPYLARNELGIKSAKGFYRYPNPSFQKDDFCQSGDNLAALYQSLISELIYHALILAATDIASPEDIDRAWTVATQLKQGPIALLDSMGHERFIETLNEQLNTGLAKQDMVNHVISYLQYRNSEKSTSAAV